MPENAEKTRGRPESPLEVGLKLTPDSLKTMRPIVAALARKGTTPADLAELLGNEYPVAVLKALFEKEFTAGHASCRFALEQKAYDTALETGDTKLLIFLLTKTGGKKWSDEGIKEELAPAKRLAIG
jgi:hypothetical protein